MRAVKSPRRVTAYAMVFGVGVYADFGPFTGTA
jgi:hypothetical protein